MSEFQEVMRQWKRMCESRGKLPDDFVGAEQALLLAMESPDEIEELVMSWAAEHPEPVYPTWREWLIKLGIVSFDADFRALLDARLNTLENTVKAYINEEGSKPIPADIAQKLGLQPKEDV